MNKRRRKVFWGIVLFFSMLIGTFASEAATKNVAGIYRSDFVPGIAQTGSYILNTLKGYSYYFFKDSTKTNFYNALENYNVVLIHTHGAEGLFTLSNNIRVTANDIKNRDGLVCNAKLVYISACKSGATSSTYGNIGSVLCAKAPVPGSNAVIAFKENISASTNSDGIHYFNQKVIGYMANGTILYQAIAKAKADLYNSTGKYYGADSCVFYGNGGLTL